MRLKRYHLLIAGAVALFSAAAVVRGLSTASFAQSKIQPYTVKIEETTRGLLSGTTLQKVKVISRRSDGSTSTRMLDAGGALLPGQIREVVLVDQAKKVLIDDARRNVSTLHLTPSSVQRLASPRPPSAGCAPRTFLSGVASKGHTTLAGSVLAHGYRFPDSKNEDSVSTLEAWFAPALDCMEVGQTATRTDARLGKLTSTYERRLIAHSSEEPSASEFVLPSGYTEVPPSVLRTENLSQVNRMQPSPQMLADWAKQDQVYAQANRDRQ